MTKKDKPTNNVGSKEPLLAALDWEPGVYWKPTGAGDSLVGTFQRLDRLAKSNGEVFPVVQIRTDDGILHAMCFSMPCSASSSKTLGRNLGNVVRSAMTASASLGPVGPTTFGACGPNTSSELLVGIAWALPRWIGWRRPRAFEQGLGWP